MGDREDIVKM